MKYGWNSEHYPYKPTGGEKYGRDKVSTNFFGRLGTEYVEFMLLAVVAFKTTNTIFGFPLDKVVNKVLDLLSFDLFQQMPGASDEANEEAKKKAETEKQLMAAQSATADGSEAKPTD